MIKEETKNIKEIDEKKITVLVTFYNQDKYVDRALKSICSQTFFNKCAVIIGDDGSTDETINKIIAWETKYKNISHFILPRETNKEYIGGFRASQNRLNILKKVETPYFVFLDGDDYWTDDRKLEKQFNILENENNKGCIACGHAITEKTEGQSIDNNGTYPSLTIKEGKIKARKYWNGMYIHTDTILFRSNHIQDLNYELLAETFNDNMITYCFLNYGDIYYIPESMCVYWKNKKGIWVGSDNITNILRNVIQYDIEIKISTKLKRNSRIRHLNQLIGFTKKDIKIEKIKTDLYRLIFDKDLEVTKRIMFKKRVFSDNVVIDNLIIIITRIQKLIDMVVYYKR